jgi:hypothetical protein
LSLKGKILGTLHEDLIRFVVAGDSKSPQKLCLRVKWLSESEDSRGGINITPTPHDIALHEHCPFCYRYQTPIVNRIALFQPFIKFNKLLQIKQPSNSATSNSKTL